MKRYRILHVSSGEFIHEEVDEIDGVWNNYINELQCIIGSNSKQPTRVLEFNYFWFPKKRIADHFYYILRHINYIREQQGSRCLLGNEFEIVEIKNG